MAAKDNEDCGAGARLRGGISAAVTTGICGSGTNKKVQGGADLETTSFISVKYQEVSIYSQILNAAFYSSFWFTSGRKGSMIRDSGTDTLVALYTSYN